MLSTDYSPHVDTTSLCPEKGSGLTTCQAPFIEAAKQQGDLFIYQPYELYSEDNHQCWATLYERMLPLWQRYANDTFNAGIDQLLLSRERVPQLEDINHDLEQLTGFRAEAVSGHVPAYMFFDKLRQRIFPTTITIRDQARLDYLPEPDCFHDMAGHVPMHMNKTFADVLVRFGEVAFIAAQRVQGIGNAEQRVQVAQSNIRALARFFWFTIEFGLMRQPHGNGLCAYGSGLLSSYSELSYAIESNNAQRFPLQIEWVINQNFEVDHFQPLYFIVEHFDELYEQMAQLESYLCAGKLDNVSPGEPGVSDIDLASFLHAQID